MARPIRNNAEFFYHPASLRDDRRVKAIRARMGVCGYGLLIMVLETLTDADFTQLDTSELELELLAGDYGVSVTEINSLLQIGEKVGYFTRTESGFLICPDLNKALEPVFEKRNRSRNVASSDRNEQKPDIPIVSATETPQSVTESTQRIVEDSIVEDNKENTPGGVTPAPPTTGDSPTQEGGKKPKPAQKEKPATEHYFKESPFYERQRFVDALKGTDYEQYDLAYYHETVKNWADSGSNAKFRKSDWIATSRNFILRDAKNGEAKLRPKTQAQSDPGQASHATYQDLMKDEYKTQLY